MALLEIKKAGDPVLKKVCAPVEKIDKRLRNFLDDMAETMYASEGVGIAAPQVGKSIRVCVVDVDTKNRNNRYDLINPVITYREGSVVDNEGCLSCPDLFGDVERAEKIRVEYLNRFGKKKTLEAEGLLARCIQHELDHLDGQLFIDIAKNITKGRKQKD
ncbi:MAG: peptide deformylase [Selenomonadaceae bacterium]|nr:peptide deformylase [Selenomonadaceae bacterium]